MPMVGIRGEMKMELADYGIHTEKSDIRAHVSVVAGKTYVFWTRLAVELCQSGKYTPKPGYQRGISTPTAMGYTIPWYEIPGIVPVGCRSIIEAQKFSEFDNTTVKGQKASKVVEHLIRAGWFPLPAMPIACEDVRIQHSGIDLIVQGSWRIQVKCDYNAGENGTGNLYLQIAERNPFGMR